MVIPEDEQTKRGIPENQIQKQGLEENDKREDGCGGKKGKSRFREILLIYVCAGVLYSCIGGWCLASVWRRTEDHHTGACYSKIIGLKVIPNYEKSEFTLTAEVEYRTSLPIFPAVKGSAEKFSWHEWYIARTGQQSEVFSFSDLKNPA